MRQEEIIAKLDDLDKRAEVVLEGQGAPGGGYQWKIQEESNLPDDGWSSESPFKAYDKVFQVPGSEVPKGIAFFWQGEGHKKKYRLAKWDVGGKW
ncbi:hypothetical protein ACJX0J_021472, partial [Zea mays]